MEITYYSELSCIGKEAIKRIIKEYDERLKEFIFFGNENVRGLAEWNKLLDSAGLKIDRNTIKFFRYYFPNRFNKSGYPKTISDENKIISSLLHRFFFYSVNFVSQKKTLHDPKFKQTSKLRIPLKILSTNRITKQHLLV